MADVDVSGLTRLAVDLGNAPSKVIKQGALLIAKTAHDIEADAKMLAAVDTGNMRNSISTTALGLSAEIGPTAAYSIFVEEGTSTQAPQPFMRPAAEKNSPLMVAGFEQILGGIL